MVRCFRPVSPIGPSGYHLERRRLAPAFGVSARTLAWSLIGKMPSVADLGDIYDEHVWRVYAFFAYRLNSREEAEDLTQATFERAVRAFRRYDERKASHLTWLMAIAQNLLVDHFRRAGTARTRPTEPEELEALAGPAPAGAESSLGLDPELAGALALLSDREREIVALRYGSDLTGPEIAELKGLTLANVQQILSRSLRRMRAAIEESRAAAIDR